MKSSLWNTSRSRDDSIEYIVLSSEFSAVIFVKILQCYQYYCVPETGQALTQLYDARRRLYERTSVLACNLLPISRGSLPAPKSSTLR